MRRISSALASAMLLASCGDNGGPPESTPTPSPASTPTPTPGSVATMTIATIPGLASADIVDNAEASNQGLYIHISGRLSNGLPADKVVKLEGDPTAASAWRTVLPEPDGTMSFAVANPYSEQRGAVDFYYIESNGHVQDPIGGIQLIWGHYSTISGISARATENRTQGIDGPVAIAAGNPTGSDQQRSWILHGYPSTASYIVKQDDGMYANGGNTLADRFSISATPTVMGSFNNMNYSRVLSSPNDARLYLTVNGTLYVYSPTTQIAKYTLNDTRFPADTLSFYDNSLFVGYEDGVWRLTGNGSLTRILTKDAQENFCIRDGEIYLAKGEAVNLQTMARRNWISTGTLTAEQTAQANNIRGTGPYRIYCSATAASPLIYSTVNGTQQIRAIQPLTP